MIIPMFIPMKCNQIPYSPIKSYSLYPIGSMYGIYDNIYHQYTPNVSIYTIHGSYGYGGFPRVISGFSSSWDLHDYGKLHSKPRREHGQEELGSSLCNRRPVA